VNQSSESRKLRQNVMTWRHRKRLVLMALISVIVLSVSLVYLLMGSVFSSAQNSGVDSANSKQSEYPLPCLKVPMDLVQSGEIHIRVLNGTTKAGYAKAVSQALALRDFSVHEPDNAPELFLDTYIYYGENTIGHAYQLSRNFYKPILVLDNREDYLIDVVIGSTFERLVPESEANLRGASKLIESPVGCVEMTTIKRPVAFTHDPQESTSQKQEGVSIDETETSAEE
jgi:hypothetical protein